MKMRWLFVAVILAAGCGGSDGPPDCGSFVACGGTLSGTSWTFEEGCGDMQSVPTTIVFSANGTYTTNNGSGTYTVSSDTVTLTVGATAQTSSFCISAGLLALQPNGDPATDYVIYSTK